MLCLSWCVASLVLYSLLLINECVCRENYLGPLKDDIVRRNVLQTSGFDNKVIRLIRQAPPPPNSPIGPPKHPPPRFDEVRRRPDHLPPPNFECRENESWMIPPGLRGGDWIPPGQVGRDKISPGQKDRGRIPPGQMKGPCGFKLPPGRRKKIWPPPIIENNKDFKYPNEQWDDILQNRRKNDVVYISDRPVILLRPEEIRK